MLVTYTGRVIEYSNIDKDNIHIDDIAHSLFNLNRFAGHSDRPYSVGEHTLRCLDMAIREGYTKREQLLVLIHDFTESYMIDLPAPLKDLFQDYVDLEDEFYYVICDKYGINPPTEDEYKRVKSIDLTMLVIEMRDLTFHEYNNFKGDLVIDTAVDDKIYKIDREYPSKSKLEEMRNVLKLSFEKLLHSEE